MIAASNVPDPKEYKPYAIKNTVPLILHHLSALLVIVFNNVWNTTVLAQKATVATKVASVNKTGGNKVLVCLSQGAQGVSMPKPSVNTAAPLVPSVPIKINVGMDFLKSMR